MYFEIHLRRARTYPTNGTASKSICLALLHKAKPYCANSSVKEALAFLYEEVTVATWACTDTHIPQKGKKKRQPNKFKWKSNGTCEVKFACRPGEKKKTVQNIGKCLHG
ncbi:hypothetical protein PoB_002793000 [Plakobranchus ocellatus]|uniref:FLYWCH-type domain-containing protein n=1 Tax=Plakobranchus ocellatus TaxID=259542 RepID=A0AAV4A3H4_9GAST|nr:hypothetical protein PoB_002793000 [Plakobranchus ocellatus]